jgi:Domain of unknown function (DUF5615)
MRVLLDEQLPLDLSAEFPGHVVHTIASRGWAGIKNGDLLGRMRGEFDVLVTMDRGIEFQHRVTALPFGIVVVRAQSNRMHDLKPLLPLITAAIDTTRPGRVQHIGA